MDGGEARPPSTLLGVEILASEELVYEIEVVCVVRSGIGWAGEGRKGVV